VEDPGDPNPEGGRLPWWVACRRSVRPQCAIERAGPARAGGESSRHQAESAVPRRVANPAVGPRAGQRGSKLRTHENQNPDDGVRAARAPAAGHADQLAEHGTSESLLRWHATEIHASPRGGGGGRLAACCSPCTSRHRRAVPSLPGPAAPPPGRAGCGRWLRPPDHTTATAVASVAIRCVAGGAEPVHGLTHSPVLQRRSDV